MKSKLSWAFLIATLIVAGCSSQGGTGAQSTAAAQPAASNDPVGRGRFVYQKNCQECHGPDGRGDGPVAYQCATKPADLQGADVANRSTRALLRKISRGGSGMPAFEKLLGEQDRRDVVEYVQALSRNSPGGRQARAD
jgi:mono/diheme cytochrome c family protein